jgi:hypothetical protein
MVPIDMMASLVEERQQHLRSLAAPRAEHPVVTVIRFHAGTSLIRLGQWIDGRRREIAIETPLTKTRLST